MKNLILNKFILASIALGRLVSYLFVYGILDDNLSIFIYKEEIMWNNMIQFMTLENGIFYQRNGIMLDYFVLAMLHQFI
jgi:hypothetical protein